MNTVSIVIPIYNMGSKLKTCVQSILQQTYNQLEIILVDDGSKDNTWEQCQMLAQQDRRVKIFHTSNQGSGPARNTGIEYASGRYIYFPDADDYLEPNAIECLEKTMRTLSCDLIVFGFQTLKKDGKIQSVKHYPAMQRKGEEVRKNYANYMTMEAPYAIQGAPWNKFFDLTLIQKYHICFPALRRHQDEAFIARYVTYTRNICFLPEVFYSYFVNDLSYQWDKYPVTYIDSVKGLYAERKTNVLTWNPQDHATHDLVYQEYITKVIKALELSFSPKFGFNQEQRRTWIIDAIRQTEISTLVCPNRLGKYHRMVMFLIKSQRITSLYNLLRLKVWIEQNGWLPKIKALLAKGAVCLSL